MFRTLCSAYAISNCTASKDIRPTAVYGMSVETGEFCYTTSIENIGRFIQTESYLCDMLNDALIEFRNHTKQYGGCDCQYIFILHKSRY